MLESTGATQSRKHFLSVQVCTSCGGVSRREEISGTADASGILHCSICGHAGPLNDQVVAEDDIRLSKRSL